RSVQDWQVRYALQAVEGVSEVASIGGFVKEYQIDVDPDAMRAYGVSLDEVYTAVRRSNADVGARTIEVNKVEYVIRGLGFVKGVRDLEMTVVAAQDGVPLFVKDVAHVSLGPALRRGALDKEGAEAVGGVVVVRHGENPLAVIKRVKDKIREISPGLPARKLENGTTSQVSVVPFYDRSGLIYETLGTLNSALTDEILITVIVILVVLGHLASSLLISLVLPLAVLLCFVGMKHFGVDANIVALSGIAIAIGTIVDMGIVVCENILKHRDEAPPGSDMRDIVFRASSEVGSAVLTAVITTVVSFLPVFAMIGPEGKLFRPLAFTKTFALIASVIVALSVIPSLAAILFRRNTAPKTRRWYPRQSLWAGLLVVVLGIFLSRHWMPLGLERSFALNFLFVAIVVGVILAGFGMLQRRYTVWLGWCLDHKRQFLLIPTGVVFLGLMCWMNLGREFMPNLDEGSFLYMPTTMPHASIGEALDILQKQDMALRAIPEVESVVGKIGRAESPLDPAPVSMIETVINYKSQFVSDKDGNPIRFRYDRRARDFARDENGELIPDRHGQPFRQWRDHIQTPDDIWKEIVEAAQVPGTTSAPKLQPIAARIVMLQSGMRAPMGVKVKGPDLQTVERVGLEIERYLKEVPSVEPSAVIADRVVGTPYLEIEIDREAAARYGVSVRSVQDVIEVAIGGVVLTRTVEGRERYPVRVRYLRELRDRIESLGRIFVPTPGGAQIPLEQLAIIKYERGPQMIKSEDTFLTGYVVFDKKSGKAEVDVVEEAKAYLKAKRNSGEWSLPAGVSFSFAGSYENQLRSAKTMTVILPLALFMIFIILYFQFRSVTVTFLVFSGIFVAWAGGFILLWLYGQPWFLDLNLFGVDLRNLFQIHPVNLSVAVWVGFLALFGIATDDGVIMATYLDKSYKNRELRSVQEIREATLAGAERRIRPCLMTVSTTLLALLPVLTSTGRGADVMVPMAIPSFGGMLAVVITVFVVPTLYCAVQERRLRRLSS
ncbi:MAG: efflux RND transporter permease subunit, partial [Candidatus Omnitrophica bacterium]|nr:efflux RND transporter permease subunit [Candidatus Omnitrophota bacterium]